MPPDDQTAIQPEAEPDLRALIGAAFDEQEEAPEPKSEPQSERQRAPDGKFAKVDAPVDASKPSESDPPQTPVKPEAEKPEVEAKPIATVEPPERWSAADKEAFRKIPAEAQEFVMRRYKDMEGDYTRKVTEIAAFKRDYEPVQQMFAPHMDAIIRGGFTPASLIKAWADVEGKLMGGQGVDVVKDIVSRYKVDRAQLARELGLVIPGAGTETPPTPDGQSPIILPPEVVRELQELRNGQTQVTQLLTQQQQRERQEAENRVMSTIEAFRSAKDASGNLIHPHYDELETEMIGLLQAARASGQQPSLDDLYEKAVWATPSTRQKMHESQRAADEAQRKVADADRAKEARAKAERAKKAGSSVTGAPGQTATSARNGESLRDQLNAAFEEVSDAA